MEGGGPPGKDLSEELGVDTHLSSKLLITVLYVLIFLVGTTGNVLTIRLVLKKQSLQSLQSTVHYHLVSLALSDILILLVSIPIELSYYFLRDICSYATVLNIASLSCERYLAICRPITAKRIMSRNRTKKILSAIWISSLLFSVPMAFIMGVKYKSSARDGEPDPSSLVCTSLVSPATLKVFIQVNVFMSFLLPVTVIAFLNCVTVGKLESLRSRSCLSLHSSCMAPSSQEARETQKTPATRSASLKGGSIRGTTWKNNLTVSSEPNRIQALQHSIYMLRAIVIAYVVCWLPYHARRLMFCYVPDDKWSEFLYNFYHYFYMLTNTLFYVSSAVNPVLYNMVSSSFRQLFFQTLDFTCSKPNVTLSVKQTTHSLKSNSCMN
uniref:Neurotensin receptor 2 n=1 Tax=Leptobrachium leishanense TaxID=445787 RepID=A0A8C5QU32_9ANUR